MSVALVPRRIRMTLPSVLQKRERGKARYDARYQRVGARLASAKKTRTSDIAVPRITDGAKPNHEATRIHQRADNLMTMRRRNPLAFMQFLLGKTEENKPHTDHQHLS
jgi:hypothetical protein